jgi:hypothetical protein
MVVTATTAQKTAQYSLNLIENWSKTPINFRSTHCP